MAWVFEPDGTDRFTLIKDTEDNIRTVEGSVVGRLVQEDAGGGSGNATVPNDGAPFSSPQDYVDSLGLFMQETTTDPAGVLSLPWLVNVAPNQAGLPGSSGNPYYYLAFIGVGTGVVTLANLESIAAGATCDFGIAKITSASCPLLATLAGVLYFDNCPDLPALSFPSLQSVTGQLGIYGNPAMASLSLPVLQTLRRRTSFDPNTGLLDASAGGLESVNIPSLVELNGNINLSDNKLSSAAVDAILNALAATVTEASSGHGRLNLTSQTPAAPPTGASADALTYLSGVGVTVDTD